MTYWRDFSTQPEEGKRIFVMSADIMLSVAQYYTRHVYPSPWEGCLWLEYPHAWPLPPLHDAAPPKNEILEMAKQQIEDAVKQLNEEGIKCEFNGVVTFSDEPPKPPFEVPKDGFIYMCWDDDHGYVFLWWHEESNSYQSSHPPGCEWSIDRVTRYMDATGNWVEGHE